MMPTESFGGSMLHWSIGTLDTTSRLRQARGRLWSFCLPTSSIDGVSHESASRTTFGRSALVQGSPEGARRRL